MALWHCGNRGDMYPVTADGTFQVGSKQVGWSAFANMLFTMPWSSSQRVKYYSSNSECTLSMQTTTGFWNWGSTCGSTESQVRKPKVQHNERARNMRYFIFPLWWFSVLCQTNFPCGRSVVRNLPAMQETRVWSLGQEDLLEKRMVTHSSILALENSMDRRDSHATVHRVAESDTT